MMLPDGPAGDASGMQKGVRLQLGAPVRCTDGAFGKLADVVIDPIKRRVTHLVVEPEGSPGLTRLVAIELAAGEKDADGISLRCSSEEAAGFPAIHESAYLRMDSVPAGDQDWDIGVQDVLAMPYYPAAGVDIGPGAFDSPVEMTYDRVPKGEVEIRRASAVVSADGHDLGRVEAFIVDGEEISDFVLERGHLWGRRDVTIPIGAVAKVETDVVTLSLSKDEVGALPARRVHRFGKR
jgi:sporulation protein YlmC with PRC-barrel domain